MLHCRQLRDDLAGMEIVCSSSVRTLGCHKWRPPPETSRQAQVEDVIFLILALSLERQ